MPSVSANGFDDVVRRMFSRDGIEALPGHLNNRHDIVVERMSQLDIGVFRVDRTNGDPVVVRMFPAARPHSAAVTDLGVLRFLADVDFPAERPVDTDPLSSHEGQAVLITEFVRAAPKAQQPSAPMVRLGARIGRLHCLDAPADLRRPAGALHHFAEGTLSDELHAAEGWLGSIELRIPDQARGSVKSIRAALAAADGGAGLPAAFVHPDPVPKNAIFTEDGPVLIDWTAAGYGPRLPSMLLILRSGWAAAPFLKGYARHVTLTDEERARLGGLLLSRALIDRAFRVCRDPNTAVSTAKSLKDLRRKTERHAGKILSS